MYLIGGMCANVDRTLDGYYVIEVYVKNNIKAKEMGDILTNIEEYAKKCGYNVLVDFLRG